MIDDIIEKYIKLRDKKKELQDKHKAELSKYDDAMERIEAHLLKQMQEQGLDSMPTAAGTAYRQVRTSATLGDREMFRKWCEANDAWGLADIRAAPVAIREYKEANDDLPPGVSFSQHVVVNIRRS